MKVVFFIIFLFFLRVEHLTIITAHVLLKIQVKIIDRQKDENVIAFHLHLTLTN